MSQIKAMQPEARRAHVQAIIDQYRELSRQTPVNRPHPLIQVTYEHGIRQTITGWPLCVARPFTGAQTDVLVMRTYYGRSDDAIALSLATIIDIEVGIIERRDQ